MVFSKCNSFQGIGCEKGKLYSCLLETKCTNCKKHQQNQYQAAWYHQQLTRLATNSRIRLWANLLQIEERAICCFRNLLSIQIQVSQGVKFATFGPAYKYNKKMFEQ